MVSRRQSVMVHGSVPQRGGNRQYRVDLTNGRAELLPTSGIIVHSRLAPDGRGILAGAYGLRVARFEQPRGHDTQGAETTFATSVRRCRPTGSRSRIGSIAPGHRRSPTSPSRTEPARVNVSSAHASTQGAHSPMNMLTWTPDQRHLIFADSEGTLWRVPVTGGGREPLGVSATSKSARNERAAGRPRTLFHRVGGIDSCGTLGIGGLPASRIRRASSGQ